MFNKNNNKTQQNISISYKILQIPDTRFEIRYLESNFNFSKFLELLGLKPQENNKHQMFIKQQSESLDDSFKYDQKILKQKQCQQICKYLENYDIPQLTEIYQILQPHKKLIRNENKYIKDKHQSYHSCIRHVGIDYRKLDEQELQALVDYYYTSKRQPFYLGYILYMFYERLHPNPSFNGIIGRLMFVENCRLNYSFPLSTFLCNVKCQYVDDVYKLFSFPQYIITPHNSFVSSSTSSQNQLKYNSLSSEQDNSKKYFSITLNKESISKIILILLFSILYYQHQNDDNETKELLLVYFQDPFRQNVNLDNIKIKNFKEIIEMINELNWNQQDKQQ